MPRKPPRLPERRRIRLGATALAAAAALGLSEAPVRGQEEVGLHGLAATQEQASSWTTRYYLHGRVDRDRRLGSWDLSAEGSVWLELGDIERSLLAPAELVVGRGWRRSELRVGMADPAWGLSRYRSPASMVAPDAILWSLAAGPPLAEPLAELTVYGDAGEVRLLLLPLRRRFHLGRLLEETWDGRGVSAAGRWEVEAGYGVRLSRTFDVMDVAVWWMDASDRRPWLREATDGGLRVTHPRGRQAGYEAQWVVGETVVRSEGALARRSGAWHSRLLVGLEWFPTPYLSVLVEQALASDRDLAASPLVDDSLVGVELVAERLRFGAGVAVDPSSGTVHQWSVLRWTLGARSALEGEWVEAWGAEEDESPVALRQPRVLRMGAVLYF